MGRTGLAVRNCMFWTSLHQLGDVTPPSPLPSAFWVDAGTDVVALYSRSRVQSMHHNATLQIKKCQRFGKRPWENALSPDITQMAF